MFGKEAYLKILITFEMGERRRGKLAGGGWVINFTKKEWHVKQIWQKDIAG